MTLRPTCPCGSKTAYDACCGRLHRGAAEAATAEELMRARYAAYAVGDNDYLFRTWHPRTRPDDLPPDDLPPDDLPPDDLPPNDVPPDGLRPDDGPTWTGLRILDGGADWVEFVASYERAGAPGELRELSRFEQRGGRWVYVDGDPGRD